MSPPPLRAGEVRPGEVLLTNISGDAGVAIDLTAPLSTPVIVQGLGRFRVQGNSRVHSLDLIDSRTNASVLPTRVNVDMSNCEWV